MCTGFELVKWEWLCHSADHFKQFFVEFMNQNFTSVRIFVFQETTKFLFSLTVCHIPAQMKL